MESFAVLLNQFAVSNSWAANAAVFFAEGFGVILLLGLVVFLFSHEHKGEGFYNVIVILAGALLAYGCASLIKYLYLAPRPFIGTNEIIPLIDSTNPYGSFPSGHAAFYMSLAVTLFFYHRRLALFYFVGALLIGIARVAAGVHFPTDILGGFIVGAAAGAFAHFIYKKIYKNKKRPWSSA